MTYSEREREFTFAKRSTLFNMTSRNMQLSDETIHKKLAKLIRP